MKEYRKRIEKLKYEILDLEIDLEKALSRGKKNLIKRLELMIREKKYKVSKWSNF
tara:strand:- start:778 stop:942 length:165 start_codon:yes stop_codon:yes gene_type:complete